MRRARESGLAVVLAALSPNDLEAVEHTLLTHVLVGDLTRFDDGRFSTRHVERPRVAIDEWMDGLDPRGAWLRVGPIDRGGRRQ